MDRFDWFFKQRVTEAELDAAFDAVELAMWDTITDLQAQGITSGLSVVESAVPDLNVQCSAGVGYDGSGRRAYREAAGSVDVSQDYTGVPSEPSQAGWERWCSVFIRRTQIEGDPRLDGNDNLIQFSLEESSEIRVRMSVEELAPATSKVPLRDDEILICDVLRLSGQTQIFDADIYFDRRQDLLFLDAGNIPVDDSGWTRISGDTVQDALDSTDGDLVGTWTWITEHANGTTDKHPADDVTVDDSTLELIGDADVQAVFENVDNELNDHLAVGNPLHIRRFSALGEALQVGSGGIDRASEQLFAVRNGRGVPSLWPGATNRFEGKTRGAFSTHTRSGDPGTLGSISSDGQRVYYSQGDHVRAIPQHAPNDGSVWAVNTWTGGGAPRGVFADGRYVYVGTSNGYWYILNKDTGATIDSGQDAVNPIDGIQADGWWCAFAQGNLLRFKGVYSVSGFPPVSATGSHDHTALVRDAAVSRHYAFGTGTENASNQDVFAYDMYGNSLHWTKDFATDSAWQGVALDADDRFVYVGGLANAISAAGVNLFCVNIATSLTVWQRFISIGGDDDVYDVVVDDRYVWVSIGTSGKLACLDKRNGEIVEVWLASTVYNATGEQWFDSDGDCFWAVDPTRLAIQRFACGGPTRVYSLADETDPQRTLYTLAPPVSGAFF